MNCCTPTDARAVARYVALQTRPTRELCFAVVGSLRDARAAKLLAAKYAAGADSSEMLAPAASYWERVTRGLRITGRHPDVSALNTIFPWLAHNAMMHLTVPHGLEQYTGAAWGTRDVCQGPVEFFLSLEHDEPVKEILRIVFAQQYEQRGDWPQWFMLEPYSSIQDRHCHGDVIIWPLKALCDYLECTNDLAFLEEPVAWRRDADFERTERKDPIFAHVEKLLATLSERLIPGNPVAPVRRGRLERLAAAGRSKDARMDGEQLVGGAAVPANQPLCGGVAPDETNRPSGVIGPFRRRDARQTSIATSSGTRPWPATPLFDPGGDRPKLLLHPTDTTTGLSYSLLPMTRSIIAGLFTPEQARHHLQLIREHLLFPDGVRLMDRPVRYRGGPEQIFRRAESASFFGREIGLMYVHAHLRYAEALAVLGEADALWEALLVVNPIAITDRLANGSLRQRNAYFSSSDAAFDDRYQAETNWEDVKAGRIAVDGGWRIYSSGPGLYASVLLRQALGRRRYFGTRSATPLLPTWLEKVTLEMAIEGRSEQRNNRGN